MIETSMSVFSTLDLAYPKSRLKARML